MRPQIHTLRLLASILDKQPSATSLQEVLFKKEPAAMKIQIRNLSTLVTDASLAPLIKALQTQVIRDFVPAYGPQVAANVALGTQNDGSTPLFLIDTDASAPAGALGWHADNDKAPYSIVTVQPVILAGLSLGQVISHELLELLADPTCTTYEPSFWPPNSTAPARIAYEVCDPVEDQAYTIQNEDGTVATVSNFVLPSWFYPTTPGPWDFLKQLTGPLTRTPAGYFQWSRFGLNWTADFSPAHIRSIRVNSKRLDRRKWPLPQQIATHP
jgi:hypothetical protein